MPERGTFISYHIIITKEMKHLVKRTQIRLHQHFNIQTSQVSQKNHLLYSGNTLVNCKRNRHLHSHNRIHKKKSRKANYSSNRSHRLHNKVQSPRLNRSRQLLQQKTKSLSTLRRKKK